MHLGLLRDFKAEVEPVIAKALEEHKRTKKV